ncbi:MAG: hypothetical protein ACTSQJ_17475 [Promethearchaeota archaeon]
MDKDNFKSLKNKFYYQIFKRGIKIESDIEIYKKIYHRGFIAALIYSIIYGIYEYYIVYNEYVGLVKVIGSVINWVIMYSGLCITVGLATRYEKRFNIEPIIMGLFLMTMLEDVIFWMCLWIDRGVFPYPAGNWWDNTIATFRILGGLGRPVPFWPYIPFYYIPGFIAIISYYLICINGPKSSRAYAWIIGPFFIAIIAGALFNDLFALICLIAIPSISYIYILTILYLNKKQINEEE